MIAMPTADKNKYEGTRVEAIPTGLIRPNPYQPRRSFTEQGLDELARSIRRYGLLQPIVVRRTHQEYFELIAGERRLRATIRAGMPTINALVYAAGDQDSAVMALIENLQRENLHFFDEAEAYRNLLMEHGLTQEELARRIGRNQSTVANKLRVLKLAPSVKEGIVRGRLTKRHARTLLRIPEETVQLALIAQIRKESLSVKATEELVEQTLERADREAKGDGCKRMVGIFRDGRLLINGIRKLVDQVCETGLNAKYQMLDHGDNYEILVVVPKRHNQP